MAQSLAETPFFERSDTEMTLLFFQEKAQAHPVDLQRHVHESFDSPSRVEAVLILFVRIM